ncbi:mce-family protein mce1f [Mycolicibacterium conceptionense]|uniref:Mce-family protein mce1f n=1 Tax=Mycolicibacterium conceptionense TaxID=451644 RepID=A0A0U1DHB9_9MYCO|nr:MlaD family protein [Mycolicibacterium conceptionense]ORV24640.1 hypothetical protein AWB98_20560 [Mycolicibacterium conceptionense]CQD16547.1 mce-family protein mce1f [Mycolicibacterium conceptionense]
MLTRFVRVQLIIFAVASLVGVAVMAFTYMQVPTLLGIGRITVTLQLPASGGLYRFSNVTYRGLQIGKVTKVDVVSPQRAEATLSLNRTPKVPADLVAEVRSVSAVGEQYVDLRPRTSQSPYLTDGSIIAAADTTIPKPVGPMLDRVSDLVNSVPATRLADLLDQSYKAFGGSGYDLGSLIDSGATISSDLSAATDRTTTLINDSAPFLDAQADSAAAIRTWAHSLAGISDQLVTNDPQIRTLLQTGPGFTREVSQLLDQVKPTLPVLLANMGTLGQVAVTYNASLEQLLVLFPAQLASIHTYGRYENNPTGMPQGEFSMTIGDPPACTVGFLPPSSWRTPADTTTIDTPDNLYCKLPQDSPIAVRGARNYPCMGHPGKRAPTVQICNSDQPFAPLAQRQHALDPYPIDPNLIAQGIAPDQRILSDDKIFGPTEGTPRPPDDPTARPPTPQAAPPALPDTPAVPPSPPAPPPAAEQAPIEVTPSHDNRDNAPGPSVAAARYNPQTGTYRGSDGNWYQQTNVVNGASTWQQLMPTR